jgi:hypothetical protein
MVLARQGDPLRIAAEPVPAFAYLCLRALLAMSTIAGRVPTLAKRTAPPSRR